MIPFACQQAWKADTKMRVDLIEQDGEILRAKLDNQLKEKEVYARNLKLHPTERHSFQFTFNPETRNAFPIKSEAIANQVENSPRGFVYYFDISTPQRFVGTAWKNESGSVSWAFLWEKDERIRKLAIDRQRSLYEQVRF